VTGWSLTADLLGPNSCGLMGRCRALELALRAETAMAALPTSAPSSIMVSYEFIEESMQIPCSLVFTCRKVSSSP
jgi:hypothetical protein